MTSLTSSNWSSTSGTIRLTNLSNDETFITKGEIQMKPDTCALGWEVRAIQNKGQKVPDAGSVMAEEAAEKIRKRILKRVKKMYKTLEQISGEGTVIRFRRKIEHKIPSKDLTETKTEYYVSRLTASGSWFDGYYSAMCNQDMAAYLVDAGWKASQMKILS